VVDIRTLVNVEHLYGVGLLVDAADDPVGSPPRAVTASQRAEERPAYPAWAHGQSSFAELKNRRRHGLRQPFGDGTSRGSLEPYLVALTAHLPLRRRRARSARTVARSRSGLPAAKRREALRDPADSVTVPQDLQCHFQAFEVIH